MERFCVLEHLLEEAHTARTIAPLLPPDDYEFTMETRGAPPSHLLIKIESFSFLSEYGIQAHESREFAAGDYKWILKIYVHGDEISAELAMVGTSSLPVGWEVNAFFSVCLYNQKLDNYLCFRGKLRRFNAIMSKWGLSKFISKKSLTDPCNGFLVDDNCVFGAEVFVIKSQPVIECVSVSKVEDPYKRGWKISNFSKLKGIWISEAFATGDHKWKVKLHPNGMGSEIGRSVSFFLQLVGSKREKLKANYCLRIKNQFHNDHCSNSGGNNWFISSGPGWGWDAFMPIGDMRDPSKGFVVNDCCLLEVKITVQLSVGDAP